MIDGNLAKDAEVSTSKTGRTYVRFVVGNRIYKNNEESTDWIDVYSFDPKIIENKASKLLKGSRVLVQGDYSSDINIRGGQAYINTRVMADFVELLVGPKKSDQETVSTYTATTETKKVEEPTPKKVEANVQTNVQDESDDLPF